MGLKEAGEFALELKKAERAKEVTIVIIFVIIVIIIIIIISIISNSILTIIIIIITTITTIIISIKLKRMAMTRSQSKELSVHGLEVGGRAAGFQSSPSSES